MKNFFLIVNMEKRLAEKTQHTIEKFLKEQGNGAVSHAWTGPRQQKYELPEGTDCIITIGGDGTLIQAARATVGSGVPIIGINRGHLGYLTQLAGRQDIEPAMQRLRDDDYTIEERMMLKAQVYRGGKCIHKDVALNEVLLTRYDSLRTIHFKVYVNGTCLNEYSADGLIVATPTGSTAYSLSAGGPIAEPEARMMIMTPICSHTINARSIIFSPEDTIRIVPQSENQIAACDGDAPIELLLGDEIVVKRSRHLARLVRLKEESFLETLRDKMTFI